MASQSQIQPEAQMLPEFLTAKLHYSGPPPWNELFVGVIPSFKFPANTLKGILRHHYNYGMQGRGFIYSDGRFGCYNCEVRLTRCNR